jgi:hypothetical protein
VKRDRRIELKVERYFSTVEFTDRYGTVNKEFHIYSEHGKQPTIGDFTIAFKKSGFEVEIKDFINMTFKPKDPSTANVISLKVIRTFRDFTYSPSTLKA